MFPACQRENPFEHIKNPTACCDWVFYWEILESIRKMRNESKYEGKDISQIMWKSIEIQLDLYISAVQKKVEELLQE